MRHALRVDAKPSENQKPSTPPKLTHHPTAPSSAVLSVPISPEIPHARHQNVTRRKHINGVRWCLTISPEQRDNTAYTTQRQWCSTKLYFTHNIAFNGIMYVEISTLRRQRRKRCEPNNTQRCRWWWWWQRERPMSPGCFYSYGMLSACSLWWAYNSRIASVIAWVLVSNAIGTDILVHTYHKTDMCEDSQRHQVHLLSHLRGVWTTNSA